MFPRSRPNYGGDRILVKSSSSWIDMSIFRLDNLGHMHVTTLTRAVCIDSLDERRLRIAEGIYDL